MNIPFLHIVEPAADDRPSCLPGFGLSCDDPNLPQCNGFGPYILPQLKNASAINRLSLSVYLGPNKANNTGAEFILGGAYDKAKMGGKPFTVKMLDPFSVTANEQPNFANVTSIAVNIPGKHAKETYSETSASGMPYILDTGNAYWYMPPHVFDVVSAGLGGNLTQNQTTGAYAVDCKYRDPAHGKGHLTVDFGAGKITVPMHQLVDEPVDGRCVAYIGRGVNEGPNLGLPFLRSAYLVYDQEAFTITMAQVRYTDKRDVREYCDGTFVVST